MKAIEAGCLAMVIFEEFTGKTVTVLSFIGELDGGSDDKDFWKVDPHFELSDLRRKMCREIHLIRIDGHEKSETEKKEITA